MRNTCVNCGSLVDEDLRKWFKDKVVQYRKGTNMVVKVQTWVKVVKKEGMQMQRV